MQGSTVTCYLI